MIIKVSKIEKGYRIENQDDGSDKVHCSVEDLVWLGMNLKNPKFKKIYEDWQNSDLSYLEVVV